jgi:hypothetical protein
MDAMVLKMMQNQQLSGKLAPPPRMAEINVGLST